MKLKKKPSEGFTLRKRFLFAHVCVLWKKKLWFKKSEISASKQSKTNRLDKDISRFLAGCYGYDYLVLSTELII